MKIKEVSDRTGLSRKTIRFYEARALFFPEKRYQNGKEFRDYSEDNVRELRHIATLRRARFTVEEIRRMRETPEETAAIFSDYRERLREEARDLNDLLAMAEAIPAESLSSAEDLIARMEYVTEELPLPAMDIHPRFRYLDELEEAYTLRKKKLNMTDQELKQRRIAAEGAVMYAAFSSKDSVSNQAAQFGEGGGFDISNSQKIAAYNLLLNSKED